MFGGIIIEVKLFIRRFLKTEKCHGWLGTLRGIISIFLRGLSSLSRMLIMFLLSGARNYPKFHIKLIIII